MNHFSSQLYSQTASGLGATNTITSMGHTINHPTTQLNSSEQYSWPTLMLPCSTQHIAIYTCVYYVLINFGRFNVHAKVFRWMMKVYPVVTALTGFQVANLVLYFAKILLHMLWLTPVSYPIMIKKGGAGFVHKGYSFSCNNKKKPIHQHHFKCDNVGCPARLTTYGFTQFKALTIGHDFAELFNPLYQLICWFLCQIIPTTKDQPATEVVNNALINLNDTQLATVSGASKL
ncbi:hypothetical protein DSO57_1005126 [Entomophthora muscae]|uniref:Uncharacterized protein n=1 Tax=Entomophthora muscae TaxID=34485 RepID=A0ACC2RYX4_9FUNG|nr:hypothetical protein DSO57_1005126 [Entomophthora muscae]